MLIQKKDYLTSVKVYCSSASFCCDELNHSFRNTCTNSSFHWEYCALSLVLTARLLAESRGSTQTSEEQRTTFKKSLLLTYMKNCVLGTNGFILSCQPNVTHIKSKVTVDMVLLHSLTLRS